MSFDTEINQLMAQIDALKKENDLLRAKSEPLSEIFEHVAIGAKLYIQTQNSQAIIEKLEAEKAELLEVLKDTANKIYSNSKIEWISVKDRLPEIGLDVLIYDSYHDYMEVCSYEDGAFNTYERMRFDLEDTTHWMPLPPPPKEVE